MRKRTFENYRGKSLAEALDALIEANESFVGTKRNEENCKKFESLKCAVDKIVKLNNADPFRVDTLTANLPEVEKTSRHSICYFDSDDLMLNLEGKAKEHFFAAVACSDKIVISGLNEKNLRVSFSVMDTWE